MHAYVLRSPSTLLGSDHIERHKKGFWKKDPSYVHTPVVVTDATKWTRVCMHIASVIFVARIMLNQVSFNSTLAVQV
jgi:hypothetical protein